MKLNEFLSLDPSKKSYQIQGFLMGKRLNFGRYRKANVGAISLKFYCCRCDNNNRYQTFSDVRCMGIDDNTVSISSLFKCAQCKKTKIPAWFIVKSSDDIHSSIPNITLVRRSLFLMKGVLFDDEDGEQVKKHFNKAQSCYIENLGVGAVVYLRVILEEALHREAKKLKIIDKNEENTAIPFRNLYEKVSQKRTIIPEEFRKNGYQLFKEMSKIVHGQRSDEHALKNFNSYKRLVEGVLDTIKNSTEIKEAARQVGLDSNGDEYE